MLFRISPHVKYIPFSISPLPSNKPPCQISKLTRSPWWLNGGFTVKRPPARLIVKMAGKHNLESTDFLDPPVTITSQWRGGRVEIDNIGLLRIGLTRHSLIVNRDCVLR